jgi:hypothetical protein
MRSAGRAPNLRYRKRADGRVEIYCAWCSSVVGLADSAEGLPDAAQYRCRCETFRAEPERLVFHKWLYSAVGDSARARIRAWRQCILLGAALVLLYVIPTVLEILVVDTLGPWLAVVGLGDLVGCLCLALVFRRTWLATGIYVATTLVEVWLYYFRLFPPYQLALLADFAPTVVVLGFIWTYPTEMPSQASRKG